MFLSSLAAGPLVNLTPVSQHDDQNYEVFIPDFVHGSVIAYPIGPEGHKLAVKRLTESRIFGEPLEAAAHSLDHASRQGLNVLFCAGKVEQPARHPSSR